MSRLCTSVKPQQSIINNHSYSSGPQHKVHCERAEMNLARCTIQPTRNRVWPTGVCVGDPNLPRSGLCVRDEGGSRPTWPPTTHQFTIDAITLLRHNLPAWRFLCLPTPVSPHTLHRVTILSFSYMSASSRQPTRSSSKLQRAKFQHSVESPFQS